MTLINGVLALSSSLAALIIAKVTVTTALALIGVWTARRSRAAVRYAVLAAGFVVMLALPIASFVAPPVRIPVKTAAAQQRAVSTFVGSAEMTPAAAPVDVAPARPRPGRLSPSALLLWGWMVGMVLFLLPVATGLWQVSSLRRAALPWRDGQSVTDRLTVDVGIHRRVPLLLHGALTGPMTCGIFHPAIVLPQEATSWEGDDLNRAIVHELEHVRRGDCVTLCLARAVCAAYWFHPLVWMAWRGLRLEAERCCDDAVLGRSEAIAYADQLVSLAKKLSTNAQPPLLAMANRADLAKRVNAVLDGRQQRGRAGRLPVALACAAAAVLLLTMSPLTVVAVAAPQFAGGDVRVPPMADADGRRSADLATTDDGVEQTGGLAVLPLTAFAAPQGTGTNATGTDVRVAPTTRFSATTRLVILNMTVTDMTGKNIEGLRASDFAVTEDDVPQTITVFEFQRLTGSPQGTQDSVSSYYILGYYSTNQNVDGKYRKIKVARIGDALARVEYRLGYYAEKTWVRVGGQGGDSNASPNFTAPNSTAPAITASNQTAPGFTAPVLVYQTQAQYSEEARKAKWQGSATVSADVDVSGEVTNVKVIRSVGYGLDEKAVQAVEQWKFQPGTKDGTPVAMPVQVEVVFRLL